MRLPRAKLWILNYVVPPLKVQGSVSHASSNYSIDHQRTDGAVNCSADDWTRARWSWKCYKEKEFRDLFLSNSNNDLVSWQDTASFFAARVNLLFGAPALKVNYYNRDDARNVCDIQRTFFCRFFLYLSPLIPIGTRERAFLCPSSSEDKERDFLVNFWKYWTHIYTFQNWLFQTFCLLPFFDTKLVHSMKCVAHKRYWKITNNIG